MTKILLAGTALISSLCVFAEPVDSISSTPSSTDQIKAEFNKQVDSIDKELTFHAGKLRFAEQSVRMKVPSGYYFIDANQSRYILETVWGNVPDEEVLGMIVRSDFLPSEINNDYSFVISYSPTGYIPTGQTTDFDHRELLEEVQNQLQESNKKRLEKGFNALQAEKWIMVPYFDSYKKAVYWATELKVNGSDESLVNYNLRLLGKNGVLKINAVGTIDQLPAIKKVLPYLLAQTSFIEGFRYEDYSPEEQSGGGMETGRIISGKKNSRFFPMYPSPWQPVPC
ncbi:DUF2167 domain-containing protein [Flavihumibacter sp. CACIAM 22H1]|uniref:DUF2167 domain-containing protein n=1 Tax=Flavihumibacter sp. CACIAM 22H1 TaxID=1812911 RepID=UPI0007A901DA|nr:DUF2167 domain-containing protein [Flavihumibacter sp. CACIAM 22H1]KYP15727.1 MAG: hypothetical protein A1D16_19425 [Flavihumibacter sp. CACIAM 22H1]